MYRILFSFFLVVALPSCVSFAPPNDAEYAPIGSLKSLSGCYRNLGETAEETTNRYLSYILWPAHNTKQHQDIQYIEVAAISNNTIRATGIGEKRVLVESEFVEGENFEFESGKITVTNKLFGSLAYPSGNPFIGAGHASVTLGIDKSGHGKLTDSITLAGTAFIFIPVAGHVAEMVRFVRTGNSCENS